MTENKNLKVPFHTHEMLRKRAKALGVKQFVLVDALLLVGLKMTNSEIQQAVVQAQLIKPPEANTTEEHQAPKQ